MIRMHEGLVLPGFSTGEKAMDETLPSGSLMVVGAPLETMLELEQKENGR